MRLIYGISILLLVAGCASSGGPQIDQTPRAPRRPELVKVYTVKPGGSYDVVAYVEVTSNPMFDNEDNLRQKLIEKAARAGGDAVIIQSDDTFTASTTTSSGQISGPRRKLSGEVIVFRRPD